VSIILAKIVRPRPRKQVSIHGSIFPRENHLRKLLFEKLKYQFLKLTLKRFDTIRVVSESLKSELIHELDLPKEKFIIAPIPILLPEHDRKKKGDLSLVVVGRLHIERNLHEILLILDGVLSLGKLKQVTFVGSGPLLSLVENWRKMNADKCKISILGNLSHSKTLTEISSHQILLSSAISEGYGLTIRESILEGTHVLARSNNGTKELSKIFGEVVHLYTTPQEAILFIQENIDCLVKFDVKPFMLVQKSLDQKHLNCLVRSWLN
jgi:glycosyltransferase involved in cell wall biosynthesis